MNEFILLLIGESESGKSTIAEYLSKKYDIPILQSYTTRPKRNENETGHIFVSFKDYMETPQDEIVAETCFGGHFYYAKKEQLKKKIIYIVDEKGYTMMKGKYPIVSVRLIRRFSRKSNRTARDQFVLPAYEFDYILPNNGKLESAYKHADEIMSSILRE